MQAYIKLAHDFPRRGDNPDEYIGPFPSTRAAWRYITLFGPITASVVTTPPPEDSPILTPDQHLAYLRSRS